MQRLRLVDCRLSRLPRVVGLCQADTPRVSEFVNGAQRRLLMCKEAGDEGWLGTFAEMVFQVSRSNPYITTPRSVARLELINVRDRPIALNNQFYEYLRFGNGRLPKHCRRNDAWPITQAVSRNNAVTFTDLTNPPQFIRVYALDPADADPTAAKRIMIQGNDNNDNQVLSQDGRNEVFGIFLNLSDSPFAQTPMSLNTLAGIQKDITYGPVQIFQVDPKTGNQTLLHTMEPTETTALYRRYYLDSLPCGRSDKPVQVTAIAKLELIPVMTDTDYCLLQNLEAIIEESQSIRYSEMDTTAAKTISQERHQQAVRFLNGELVHYLGKDDPAVVFAPFGSASLERVNIGMI